jgi:phage tail-like protein
MEADLKTTSSYIAHLPAILQQGPFMRRFLLAFEAILSGGIAPPEEGQTTPVGLEATLDGVHKLLMPDIAPEEFLPWLAQWVARSINDDWSLATTRAILGQTIPLYRKRGTKEGLQAVLDICTGGATVTEIPTDPRPHYFEVTLTVAERDPALLASKARQVRSIIDQEKPAHTYYALRIQYPGLRISNSPSAANGYGEGMIVGHNTVLGTVAASSSELKSGSS